jgi:signal transduction histidine kinase
MLEQPSSTVSRGEDWGRTGSSLSVTHLLGNLPVPVVFLDISGRMSNLNTSAENVLVRSAKDCLGVPFEDVLSKGRAPNNPSPFLQAFDKCLTGNPARVDLSLPTARGDIDYKCLLLPTSDEHGLVDGATVLFLEEQAAGMTSEGRSLESVKVLARTSTDLIENADLKEIIEDEAARLVESLGLDFAIFRIITPDERPLMLCHGIDYKEAREILESKLADGTPMYMNVCKGHCMLVNDLADSTELKCASPDVRSLAGLTVHWSKKAYGCAVFGTRRPGVSLKSHYPFLQVFCNQVGISLRNAALYRELKTRNTELRGMYETTQALSSTLDLQELLHTILQTARDLVGADNCFIFQLNAVQGTLRLISMIGSEGIPPGVELKSGEGITGYVAETGKGLLVERADLDPRSVTVPGTPEDDPSSIICVPLKFSEKMLGVMTLEKRPGVPFDRKQYELIELFSLQTAMAMHSASQFEKIKDYASNLQVYNVLLTHDVANFNVPIHGFLEMLLKDPKMDERQRRYVRSALVQSDNISELISDVRELSRLRSKLGEMPLEAVDMVPVIREAKEDIFSNAVYEDIETRFESTVETAEIKADAFLKDLFYNLMSNACKYGRGLPVEIKITEQCDDTGDWWKVQIVDGGRGIPDERKAGLFKRFDQLDTEQGSDGHGLGLSVVGALCERYGGRVWAEDRVPGDFSKGSVFTLLLPKLVRSTEEM